MSWVLDIGVVAILGCGGEVKGEVCVLEVVFELNAMLLELIARYAEGEVCWPRASGHGQSGLRFREMRGDD